MMRELFIFVAATALSASPAFASVDEHERNKQLALETLEQLRSGDAPDVALVQRDSDSAAKQPLSEAEAKSRLVRCNGPDPFVVKLWTPEPEMRGMAVNLDCDPKGSIGVILMYREEQLVEIDFRPSRLMFVPPPLKTDGGH